MRDVHVPKAIADDLMRELREHVSETNPNEDETAWMDRVDGSRSRPQPSWQPTKGCLVFLCLYLRLQGVGRPYPNPSPDPFATPNFPTEKDGTLPITKRISGAGNTIYTCHVVVAKRRSYNCELLPDLSRITIPSNLVWRYWNSHERHNRLPQPSSTPRCPTESTIYQQRVSSGAYMRLMDNITAIKSRALVFSEYKHDFYQDSKRGFISHSADGNPTPFKMWLFGEIASRNLGTLHQASRNHYLGKRPVRLLHLIADFSRVSHNILSN